MGRLVLDGSSVAGGSSAAARARVATAMQRSIALALGLVGCQGRAIIPDDATASSGDEGDDESSDGSDEGTGEGTQTTDPSASATATSVTSVTTASTSATSTTSDDTGDGECEVDPAVWGQLRVCIASNGSCETCDDDPECRALAESLSDACSPEFQYTVCGPELVADMCCSVVYVEDFGCAGRPFVVDGAARMADPVRRDDWRAGASPRVDDLDPGARATIAAHWRATALAEHASVASFARFVLDLLAVGAPPELILAAQRALGDEVVHARLAFGLATAYGGEPVGPGPLGVEGAVSGERTLAEIVRSVVIEGCVGETVSAAQAELALLECSDPAVRRVLTTIARDERRHAQLAWQFVAWALAHDPSLRGVVEDTFTVALVEIDLGPSHEDAPLGVGDATHRAHGVLAREELLATTHAIALEVIAPCYTAMLDETAPIAA